MKSIAAIIQKWRSELNETQPEAQNAESSSSERRQYGMGIRLWDDKDPRADQSFFLGGVPGFVLGQNQQVIDWNAAFEVAFQGLPDLKRGMDVSQWYKAIDNFRRIPNREAKLYGEGLIPITDRERVVFLSPVYGRMVFMKIMSPILDRMSGRIIGWNITLNINSVTERVKFFEDLYQRIDSQSRHSRYVAGIEQILAQSSMHKEFVNLIGNEVGQARRPLIVGALKSEQLVTTLLEKNSSMVLTVVDSDPEALRLLKSSCGRFHKRLRLVRRDWNSFGEISFAKFDALVIHYPRFSREELVSLMGDMNRSLRNDVQIIIAGYCSDDATGKWWQRVREELEQSRQLDLLKWHWQTVSEEDQKLQNSAASLPLSADFAAEFLDHFDLEMSAASFGVLAGYGAILVARPKLAMKSAV